MFNVGTSLNRLEKRSLIEDYCFYAEYFLPSDEKLLFLMYYRHGYSSIEIGKLMNIHSHTALRRISKIGFKLQKLINEELEKDEAIVVRARARKTIMPRPCRISKSTTRTRSY